VLLLLFFLLFCFVFQDRATEDGQVGGAGDSRRCLREDLWSGERQAAGLLGDFTGVSDKFLEQTLDKKLMSHLRGIKSEHQRQLELHQAGGMAYVDWDSGRSWSTGPAKVMMEFRELVH